MFSRTLHQLNSEWCAIVHRKEDQRSPDNNDTMALVLVGFDSGNSIENDHDEGDSCLQPLASVCLLSSVSQSLAYVEHSITVVPLGLRTHTYHWAVWLLEYSIFASFGVPKSCKEKRASDFFFLFFFFGLNSHRFYFFIFFFFFSLFDNFFCYAIHFPDAWARHTTNINFSLRVHYVVLLRVCLSCRSHSSAPPRLFGLAPHCNEITLYTYSYL